MEAKKKAMIALCVVIIIAGVLLIVKHNHDRQDVPSGGTVTEQEETSDLEEPSVVEQQEEEQESQNENEKVEEVYEGDIEGQTFQMEDTTLDFLDKNRLVISIQTGDGMQDTMYRYSLGGDRITLEADGLSYTYSFDRTENGIMIDGTNYELISNGGDGESEGDVQ